MHSALVLVLGTGIGIGVMILANAEHPDWRAYAVDISPQVPEIAAANAQ